MIWLNPWAWLGLAALAVPVLIHLLGRHSAHVEPFPTLRFLGTAPLLAVRRTRPTDLLLLFVRLAIVAAAVAALAQPLLLTANRRAASRSLARVILVDTSASMQWLTAAGERGTTVARRTADSLAREAGTSLVVATASPAGQLEGAVAWLEHQPGAREVVVVSDFQVGALDTVDIAMGIGVRLHRIATVPESEIIVPASRGEDAWSARVTLTDDVTQLEWSESGSSEPRDSALILLAGVDESAAAAAARRAAAMIAPPAQDPRAIAIVYPRYPERDVLMSEAAPLDQPWMGDVVARLRRDDLLAAAATDAVVDSGYVSDRFVRVTMNGAGRPVVTAARGNVDGENLLLLFLRADAGSLASAALFAAVTRARNADTPVTEHEPDVISDEVLHGWEREAEPDEASGLAGASDGRWLWLAVLLLLGLEAWMRRARRAEP